MKPGELRDMTAEELRTKIDDLLQELFRLRIQNATGQLKNTSRIQLLRKDIARARTILKVKMTSRREEAAASKG